MQEIEGLSKVIDRYDGFILDQFGVLHNGEKTYPDILNVLTHLRERNKKIVIVSNSPWLSTPAKLHLADKYNITPALYDGFITAGDMALQSMRQIKYGDRVWLIGHEPFDQIINDLPLTRAKGPEDSDFILNCIPGTGPSEQAEFRRLLKIAATRNLMMICANPDLTVTIGVQSFICAGSYAKYYEELGGKVVYFGKPHPGIYVQAWQGMAGVDRKRILAVGDSLHTDIQGARGFGVDSLMTLCGIHWEEIKMHHAPEKADMTLVQNLLEQSIHKPNYFMRELRW